MTQSEARPAQTFRGRPRDGLRGIFIGVGGGEPPTVDRVPATDSPIDLDQLAALIVEAKAIAKRYRSLTGRPLGITGEIAEYEAVRLLNLQRIGAIRVENEWDGVLLVLMDADFEPFAIHEADRPAIEAALTAPGSKARNERGALAVSKFIPIGRQAGPIPLPFPLRFPRPREFGLGQPFGLTFRDQKIRFWSATFLRGVGRMMGWTPPDGICVPR
jgi:hypothetical protein